MRTSGLISEQGHSRNTVAEYPKHLISENTSDPKHKLQSSTTANADKNSDLIEYTSENRRTSQPATDQRYRASPLSWKRLRLAKRLEQLSLRLAAWVKVINRLNLSSGIIDELMSSLETQEWQTFHTAEQQSRI